MLPMMPDYLPPCLPLPQGFSGNNLQRMTPLEERQVTLTLDDGQHDPPRIGWWFVTGPQPERDAYATIELSKIYLDVAGPALVRYRWYLNRRTNRRLEQIADGTGYTRDQAMEQITNAWTQLLGWN